MAIDMTDIDIYEGVETEEAREGNDVRLIERFIHKIVEEEEMVINTQPSKTLETVWETVEEDEKNV